MLAALKKSAGNESSPTAAKVLNRLIENAQIAADEKIPLCQDTGLTIVFVEFGSQVIIRPPAASSEATLTEAINAGVAAGSEKGYLRKSVVAEPLKERKNTGSNSPAVVHISMVSGDRLKLTVMLKGGGCENKSRFKMFNPTASREQILDWLASVTAQAGADACPPFIIGVGIGGSFEQSCLLSKKALCRNLDERNPDLFYADFENELLSRINKLGIGPMGLGGATTALGCMVETAPCHIASLPVAANIECHSHRHKSAII